MYLTLFLWLGMPRKSSNKTRRGGESGRTTGVVKVIGGISQDSPFFEINPACIILKAQERSHEHLCPRNNVSQGYLGLPGSMGMADLDA